MVDIVEDVNGDKLLTLTNIERIIAQDIVLSYIKRGWGVENAEELKKEIFFSDKRWVNITFRLDKKTQLKQTT